MLLVQPNATKYKHVERPGFAATCFISDKEPIIRVSFDDDNLDKVHFVPLSLSIAITEQCQLSCPYCYASSKPNSTTFITLKQLQWLFEEKIAVDEYPFEVLLGGGEPTIHPEFEAMVEAIARDYRTTVNVTTNGVRFANANVTERNQLLGLFDKWVGAIGLSYHAHASDVFWKALDVLGQIGDSVSIYAHVILSRENYDGITKFIANKLISDPRVDGIMLLEYRSVGRGQTNKPMFLSYEQQMDLAKRLSSWIVQKPVMVAATLFPVYAKAVEILLNRGIRVSLTPNTTGLTYAYIDTHMNLCTDSHYKMIHVPLSQYETLEDAFNSEPFKQYRKQIQILKRTLQNKCPVVRYCMGAEYGACRSECLYSEGDRI